jgi:hypothetical protein
MFQEAVDFLDFTEFSGFNQTCFYTVGPRYSAIEGAEKNSHKIEVCTISRSILKVLLLKGPKIFRTKSRFALYRDALYRGSTVIVNFIAFLKFLSKTKILHRYYNF